MKIKNHEVPFVKIVIIVMMTILSSLIKAETQESFDALLLAYKKVAIKYEVSKTMSAISPGEEDYWRQQYYFYHSKITKLLDNFDQAARKSPREFCLQTLKMYDKYSKANSGIYISDELNQSMFYLNQQISLMDYCSRYDIYYDFSQEKM